MSDLVVIVPSRGRPHAAAELAEAFEQTCTADTELCLAVDDNDPDRDRYSEIVWQSGIRASVGVAEDSSSMVCALNQAAHAVVDVFKPAPYAVAFMGDDHRPRTQGWDKAYLDALHELGSGIVYGDDLLQGARLPTQCAMTSDIVRALGYMAPPALRHLYVDNFWLDLGLEADCLEYLPGVVVEHLHPIAGKAQWDEGYVRVNSHAQYDTDRAAYEQFKASGGLAADVAKVRALREAVNG